MLNDERSGDRSGDRAGDRSGSGDRPEGPSGGRAEDGSGVRSIDGLRAGLWARLGDTARAWLDGALAEAARAADAPAQPDAAGGRPPAWELRFASAGRKCGPRAHAPSGPAGPLAGTGTSAAAAGGGTGGEPAGAPGGEATDVPSDDPGDLARVLLLHTAGAGAATVTRLYEHGTAAERRAVLLALPYLPLGDAGVPLVEDALRANDTRLVAAALGPYAAARLDAHGWRHAVLKCLFTGVPVSAVAGLGDRARGDAELARMLQDYARERTAAGRAVPDDLHHVLALTGAGPGRQADPALPLTEES